MNSLKQAIQLLEQADAIVVFAGAGMSVDSGLEQFRGTNGLWGKYIDNTCKNIVVLEIGAGKQ